MRNRTAIGVLVMTGALTAVASSALAQPAALPENHYKVYNSSAIGITKTISLQDQFGAFSMSNPTFNRFSTPAEKRHMDGTTYPMYNPDIHMDWWEFFYPQPLRAVTVSDQFGQSNWLVKYAHYLLTPSLKNVPVPPPPVPVWNHYLCYDALVGPTVGQVVVLVDQFGTAQVQVLQQRYFCNPVRKEVDGIVYPIVDPVVHLACYTVENPIPTSISITTVDQFGYWQTQIYDNDCLCVPALKDHPVRTDKSTWGRIKALYRD